MKCVYEDKEWKKRIDEIANSIPDWEEHWKAYKEKHPEEPMSEVFKKASFTRRMYIAKQIKKMLREMVKEISQMRQLMEDLS